MRRIKAVLFDMDGVLVDATEWHYEALNKALALFGFTIHRHEHLSVYNGLPTSKKLEMLTVEKGLPRALHETISQLKQHYTRIEILTQCIPSFQHEFMIRQLKRDGYRLAVCSNAIRESVDIMLRASALLEGFDLILSNEDVELPKPNPEMYLKAFERLGFQPEEAVIVEDAGPGVEAAKRSGAFLLQVSGFTDVNYTLVREFINKLQAREPATVAA